MQLKSSLLSGAILLLSTSNAQAGVPAPFPMVEGSECADLRNKNYAPTTIQRDVFPLPTGALGSHLQSWTAFKDICNFASKVPAELRPEFDVYTKSIAASLSGGAVTAISVFAACPSDAVNSLLTHITMPACTGAPVPSPSLSTGSGSTTAPTSSVSRPPHMAPPFHGTVGNNSTVGTNNTTAAPSVPAPPAPSTPAAPAPPPSASASTTPSAASHVLGGTQALFNVVLAMGFICTVAVLL